MQDSSIPPTFDSPFYHFPSSFVASFRIQDPGWSRGLSWQKCSPGPLPGMEVAPRGVREERDMGKMG